MKRINAISTILFSLFVSSCLGKQEKLDCSNVKKGKFEYKGGFSDRHFTIERDDSIQIEKNEETGIGMKLGIEWMEACEYRLTALAYIINGKDSAVNISDFPPIKTSIKKITKNYYVCESVFEGQNTTHRDTMLIVK